jgi:hypothetical protein
VANVVPIPKPKKRSPRPKLVHQFLVVLSGTDPLVWRRIQVPESADGDRTYPRCIAGEGRCPPEDCGGVHGYAEFLQVIVDPEHEEYESTLQWAGAGFDPAAFDPAAVKFDDPKKRWKKAFERRS